MLSLPKSRLNFFLDRGVYLAILTYLAALAFSTALMEIACVVALLGWAVLKFERRQWKSLPVEKETFFFLAVFAMLSVISFFWSEFPKQSFRGIFKVLKQVLLFWMVTETLNTPARQKTAFRVLTFVFIGLGLDGAWQYVFGKDLIRHIAFEPASSGPRISASFHNYGLLASFVISFLPPLVSRFERSAAWTQKLGASLATALGLLLLFWTRLRGAWVALFGGICFFLWNSKKRMYLALVLLAALGGLFALPRSMVIHLDSQGKEQSLIERFYLWDRAIQVVKARPWTGTGINTYSVAHQKYDRTQSWRVKNYYAHNGYLQIAAETGLPSLFCLLTFFFLYFRGAFQTLRKIPEGMERRTLVGFLTGLVNFLILAVIDTIFHNPPAVMGFWFLMGWAAAYRNLLEPNRAVSSLED